MSSDRSSSLISLSRLRGRAGEGAGEGARRRIALALAVVALSSGGGAIALAQQAQSTERPRFSHEQHRGLEINVADCKACHGLSSNYTVLAPLAGKNHQPCADANCHASEFFAKQPRICVVCHEGSEPWKKLDARLEQVADSEFGQDLSHATHARAGAGSAGCKHCHGDPYAGTPPQRGHASCAPCHGKTAEPAMGNCGDCHRLGAERAQVARGHSEWSVAAQFSHLNHGRDPDGGENDCVICHERIATSRSIAQVPNPTMQSCDACHDGSVAFKTTGFQCYRCHAQEAQ